MLWEPSRLCFCLWYAFFKLSILELEGGLSGTAWSRMQAGSSRTHHWLPPHLLFSCWEVRVHQVNLIGLQRLLPRILFFFFFKDKSRLWRLKASVLCLQHSFYRGKLNYRMLTVKESWMSHPRRHSSPGCTCSGCLTELSVSLFIGVGPDGLQGPLPTQTALWSQIIVTQLPQWSPKTKPLLSST